MNVKTSVLEILEQNRGQSCSGEEIAVRLNVTRAAVWKAIKALSAEGYVIESQRSKGYVLSDKSDVLSEQEIRSTLSAEYRNVRIIALDTVDSTNTYAKSLIAGGMTETAIIAAAEQTLGRGRRGKSFFSPKGKGVYFSIILHPKMPIDTSILLTVAAAVAVSRVVESISGNSTGIKWVNDIFCNGKKICGILSEAVCDMESGMIESIVVGIGINLSSRPEDFPEEIRGIAGSVFPENAKRAEVVGRIASELLTMARDLSAPELIKEYKSRLFILGQEIEYKKDGEIRRGVAADITDECALVVRSGESTDILSSGEISLGSGAFV